MTDEEFQEHEQNFSRNKYSVGGFGAMVVYELLNEIRRLRPMETYLTLCGRRCGLNRCRGLVIPDVTNRPMCSSCGPQNMLKFSSWEVE